jgi:hypothetical protein
MQGWRGHHGSWLKGFRGRRAEVFWLGEGEIPLIFKLLCNMMTVPGNLQIRWGGGSRGDSPAINHTEAFRKNPHHR